MYWFQEFKGLMNLLRDDLKSYAKQIATLLALILGVLVVFAFKLS